MAADTTADDLLRRKAQEPCEGSDATCVEAEEPQPCAPCFARAVIRCASHTLEADKEKSIDPELRLLRRIVTENRGGWDFHEEGWSALDQWRQNYGDTEKSRKSSFCSCPDKENHSRECGPEK